MKAQFTYIALTVLHLSRHEFCRMQPGLFFDMVQLYKDSLPRSGGEDIT